MSHWIEIEPDFGAYLALPPAGKGPGLALFAEIFGINPHIRAVADQYALDGFVVLAPDLFWRQQARVELGYEGDDRARAMQLVQAYAADPAAIVADVGAAVQTLRARSEVGGAKMGAIGYCLGGRLAYVAASEGGDAGATDRGVDAAVCYYGGGIHNMLDRAPNVRCPIQFHYAEHDDNIPLAAVDKVRDAMVGKAADLHVYAGAHHGFNCWARSSYHAPSAALAHGRSLQFLAQALF